MFITLIETAQTLKTFKSSEFCIDSAIADGLLRNRYKVSTNSSQPLQELTSQSLQDVSRLEALNYFTMFYHVKTLMSISQRY